MPEWDKLEEHCRKLHGLLLNREEGLSTWNLAVGQHWKAISDMWTGEAYKEDKEDVG